MGKPIVVARTTVVDDVLLVDTDRSITGQDGVGYDSVAFAAADESFPGRLAERIFQSIDGIGHVFIASNQAVIGRSGGWDEAAKAAAVDVVANFFVFYPEG
jgi:hypothetical protein